jgi:transposase
MRKITEVLRLKHQCAATNREIATACAIGCATVHEYLARAKRAGIGWPLPPDMTEETLQSKLFPPPLVLPKDQRPLPDWPEVKRQLARKGVTLHLLWEEYAAVHANPYGYSRFQELFRAWEDIAFPRMRQSHQPGDKLFVDYAGQTMPVTDPTTGDIHNAQIFVAVLGASNYTYAEATWTQSVAEWIASQVRALQFFGGVPRALVPDNLKSGVTAPNYYEPDLNPTYQEFARHYGVAILPCRVRKPRDKAKVENGVLQAERRLLAPLRDHTFFSMPQLNQALVEQLEALNLRPMQELGTSRKELFETLERPALLPLPEQPYEMAQWVRARVHIDYHIDVCRHFYSVPYALIGQNVEGRLTEHTLEVFAGGQRVTSHLRSFVRGGFTTLPEHRPPHHAFLARTDTVWLLASAEKIGPSTHQMFTRIFGQRAHEEEGYRACLGLLRLGNQHGSGPLEAACREALERGNLGYRAVQAILATETTAAQADLPAPVVHENIRGAAYYQPVPETQRETPCCSTPLSIN